MTFIKTIFDGTKAVPVSWFNTLQDWLLAHKTQHAPGGSDSVFPAIGTDGYLHMAADGTLAIAGGSGNSIINGNFDIWQQGTSFSTSGAIAADRWYIYTSSPTITATQITASVPVGSKNTIRIQRTAGQGAGDIYLAYAGLEVLDGIKLAGRTVTLQFKAKCGANYSAASSNLTYSIQNATGSTDTTFAKSQVPGYSGGNVIASGNVVLTTSWQTFSVTFAVPSGATNLSFSLKEAATGTAGANDWFEVSQVKLEQGSVATPYVAPLYSDELYRCERYGYVLTSTSAPYTYFGSSSVVSASKMRVITTFPQRMRSVPSLVTSGYQTFGIQTTTLIPCTSNPVLDYASDVSVSIAYISSSASMTPGQAWSAIANNTLSAYIIFSSEL